MARTTLKNPVILILDEEALLGANGPCAEMRALKQAEEQAAASPAG